MYTETTGSRKTIGDVDIVYHDGIYHLFHLVLPNHDFVAHAVSNDCFSWRRVENALHLGDPGSFDDSMLWTTHVTRHPHRQGWWRMFYTGLSRRDMGLKQRIGMAESDNLYTWKKSPVAWVDRRSELPYQLPGRPPQPSFSYDPNSCFPIGPGEEHYESSAMEGRHWVSWRDPFYYADGERGWLLTAGRVKEGPIVRRGCVAVMEETSPNHFESRPPLHHPGLYDDIEVPNLFRIEDNYYLIGSIREDAKIRYWTTDAIGKPWKSYADNVLLASGNYAGRICHDDKGWLLFGFFTPGSQGRTVHNLMPPPKRLRRLPSGHLTASTFEGFEDRIQSEVTVEQLIPIRENGCSDCVRESNGDFRIGCQSGFQAQTLQEDLSCFDLRADLRKIGEGKCGIVFRINRETHDGYFLSLDLFKGVAQMRAWGSGAAGSGENMMQFQPLQAGFWETAERGVASIRLIAYGSYLELAINDRVVLSLADQTFLFGAVGFYVESAEMEISNLKVNQLQSPVQSDEHLATG